MADEYLSDPMDYITTHPGWKFARDAARERYAAGDPHPELARRTFDALDAAAISNGLVPGH
jgi:hypothetical protein